MERLKEFEKEFKILRRVKRILNFVKGYGKVKKSKNKGLIGGLRGVKVSSIAYWGYEDTSLAFTMNFHYIKNFMHKKSLRNSKNTYRQN